MAKGLAAADLRTSTEEELDGKLAEAKIELFNLRFQAATGQRGVTIRWMSSFFFASRQRAHPASPSSGSPITRLAWRPGLTTAPGLRLQLLGSVKTIWIFKPRAFVSGDSGSDLSTSCARWHKIVLFSKSFSLRRS